MIRWGFWNQQGIYLLNLKIVEKMISSYMSKELIKKRIPISGVLEKPRAIVR